MKKKLLFFLFFCFALNLSAQQTLLSFSELQKRKLFKSLADASETPLEVYKLSLAQQNLTELPKKIKDFKNLQFLSIGGNNLKEIPEWIGELKNLTEITCGENPLITLPDQLFSLPHLEQLRCNEAKQFTTIPAAIKNAKKLKYISFVACNISKIPKEIGKMPALQNLRISYNNLIEIPDELGNIKTLENLELRENQLKKLPNSLDKLENITEIDISNNPFLSFPTQIFTLKNLVYLRYEKNKLTEIPKEITKLTKLKTIDFRGNEIKELSQYLINLPDLKTILCSDNPLTKIDEELLAKKGLTIIQNSFTIKKGKIQETSYENDFSKIKELSKNNKIDEAIKLAQEVQAQALKNEKEKTKNEYYTKALLYESLINFFGKRKDEHEKIHEKIVKMFENNQLHNETFFSYLKELNDFYKKEKNIKKQLELTTFIFEWRQKQKNTSISDLYDACRDYADALDKKNGDYGFKESEKYYLKTDSLAHIYKKTPEGNSFSLAYWKENFADFYLKHEKYNEAHTIFEASKKMLKKDIVEFAKMKKEEDKIYLFTPSVMYNKVLKKQYMTYYKQQKLDSSIIIAQELIDILEKNIENDEKQYFKEVGNLITLYEKDFQYDKVIPYLEKVKKQRELLYGKKSNQYKNSLNHLAFAYNQTENYAKAEPLYKEEAENTLQEIESKFPVMSEKEKVQLYTEFESNFQFYTSLVLNYHEKNPSLWAWLYNLQLFLKGSLLNSSIRTRQQIMQSNDENLKQKFEEWQNKKENLIKAYQMSNKERYEKNINTNTLEKQIEILEQIIGLKLSKFSKNTNKKRYSWQDIQKKLKKDEAAIEIYRLEKWKQRVNEGIFYVVLIVKNDTKNQPEFVVIEGGSIFDNDFEERFLKRYNNKIKNKVEDKDSYNVYWKPIAQKLKGIKKVWFSPDGVYNQLSMKSLYNAETQKYLADEIDIQIVGNTKELLTQNTKPKNKPKDATLIGFPDYNGDFKNNNPSDKKQDRALQNLLTQAKKDKKQRFLEGENITELPATKIEVDDLENILKKQNIQTQKFIAKEATEETIKNLKNPQVLHIATHGFFLQDIQNEEGNQRSFAGYDQNKIVENPLLRSGLLLAGAKNAFVGKTSENQEDGILTSMEAMNLDLDDTDLVVLSACETGLGEVKNGEGVYGLQRAFQTAGAKSVLMSLWTVSDEATQKLMTYFYENWITKKMSKREAFNMAQIQLRKEFPEPYYWAAFVLVGD
ncbi:MAG: CHAT domain-containing protein [Bacteroidetes bacterium]|nr:MAG: CHAT domain-containing protein [Bacteroidota bacterium]TAG86454.1 MAG: CHAT domain-containing protein [Bacteroidota bacterium]